VCVATLLSWPARGIVPHRGRLTVRLGYGREGQSPTLSFTAPSGRRWTCFTSSDPSAATLASRRAGLSYLPPGAQRSPTWRRKAWHGKPGAEISEESRREVPSHDGRTGLLNDHMEKLSTASFVGRVKPMLRSAIRL